MKAVILPLQITGVVLSVIIGQMIGRYLGTMEISSYYSEVPSQVSAFGFSFGFWGMIIGLSYHVFSGDKHYKYSLSLILLSACFIGIGGGYSMETFQHEEKFGSFLLETMSGYTTLIMSGFGIIAVTMRQLRPAGF